MTQSLLLEPPAQQELPSGCGKSGGRSHSWGLNQWVRIAHLLLRPPLVYRQVGGQCDPSVLKGTQEEHTHIPIFTHMNPFLPLLEVRALWKGSRSSSPQGCGPHSDWHRAMGPQTHVRPLSRLQVCCKSACHV